MVAILAFIGGLYAINNLFFSPKQMGESFNREGAAGYAASFVSAYFTYSAEGFEPVSSYTDLRDHRRSQETLQSQEVLSAQAVEINQLQDNYLQAKVLANVRSKVLNKTPYGDRQEIVRNTYLVSLRLLEETGGYKIVHYPALQLYERSNQTQPPYPPQAQEDITEQMRPMATSFFRTFFLSKNTGDISNFFTASAEIPQPLNGKLEFISLDKLEVYGASRPYLVYATLKALESSTGMEMPLTFEMFITTENNRFLIKQLNF